MTIADHVLNFYQSFAPPLRMPNGTVLHNPFLDRARQQAITEFYKKFFEDNAPRVHLYGINPSRINDSSTGVHYTDGYALDAFCGIPNSFSKGRELTSRFFYQVVERAGGATVFYKRVFAWALMPISITRFGEYKNFYETDIVEFFLGSVKENIEWVRDKVTSDGRVIILGTGDNKDAFEKLEGFPFEYENVYYLPHPRWVLQYHSSDAEKYIDLYLEALGF